MVAKRASVYEGVRNVLLEALGVDEEEVVEGASLSEDLGAESIDFIDIIFRLEKEFSLKIPRGALYCHNWEGLNDTRYIDDGRLNRQGMERIAEAYPHVDFSRIASDPDIFHLSRIQTVGSLVRYVENHLSEGRRKRGRR